MVEILPFTLPFAAIGYTMILLVFGGGVISAGVIFLIARLFGP